MSVNEAGKKWLAGAMKNGDFVATRNGLSAEELGLFFAEATVFRKSDGGYFVVVNRDGIYQEHDEFTREEWLKLVADSNFSIKAAIGELR